MRLFIKILVLCLATYSSTVLGQNSLFCKEGQHRPVVDGALNDVAWTAQNPLSVSDSVAKITHTLRCAIYKNRIYMAVEFSDETENRVHKRRVWDVAREIYTVGPKREDTLILKWLMSGSESDFSLSGDRSHTADVWYWKAFRTDHSYTADDKYHIYTNEPLPKAKRLLSKRGTRFYLVRKGDAGQAAYKTRIQFQNTGNNEVDGYTLQTPEGSRGDIQAKGVWNSGRWTVEFSRALDTGHDDDIKLERGGLYYMGVSRYEIAGNSVNDNIEIPLFGSGDILSTIAISIPPKRAASK